MAQTNQQGREYHKGKALSDDMRMVIVKDIEERGGNKLTGDVPRGTYATVGAKYRVSKSTVLSVWLKLCEDGDPSKRQHGGGKKRKLQDTDLELIETLITEQPTIQYKTIIQRLEEYSSTENVTKQNISRAVLNYLPGGKCTFKKVSRIHSERFSERNLEYSQAFLDYMSTVNPHKIKFFDESGFKISVANRDYGHSPVNTRCIETGRFLATANTTLNLCVCLNGVVYYNFVDGPSNTDHFINFWHEAGESFTEQGTPCLEPGDVVIIDNCAIHRYQAEIHISDFLGRMGIEYIFLPSYSPDFNPAENCFGKLKTLLKQDRFQNMVQANLKVAVGTALREISATDMEQFYRATGYMNV